MAVTTKLTAAQESRADRRAREVEQQMTDDERFSLLVSVMGENPVVPLTRDERVPREDPGNLGGYTSGRVSAWHTSHADERRKPRRHQPWLRQPRGRHDHGAAGERRARRNLQPRDRLWRRPHNRSRGAEQGVQRPCWRAESILPATHAMGAPSNTCPKTRSLSAVLCAELINCIQSEGMISTIKHYSLNCNEVMRHWLDAVIEPAAHRESDLLAFEIAIERSQPGAGHDRLQQDQRRLCRRQRCAAQRRA